jgi:hypothetical protein
MRDWTLLVMAAGGSRRYGRVKQTDPLGPHGETLIDYSTFDALNNGCKRVVFIVRHDLEDAFRSAVGHRIEQQIDVDYAFQDDVLPATSRVKPWGTAHAVLAAANIIKEPFAVINADDYYGNPAFQALGEHFRSGNQNEALVGFHLRDTLSEFGPVKRGLCALDKDFLYEVEEVDRVQRTEHGIECIDGTGTRRHLTGDEIVSMNVWGFDSTILADMNDEWLAFVRRHEHDENVEFYIPNVVGQLIAKGKRRCQVLTAPSSWFGITYPEDRPIARRRIRGLIDAGLYPENLWLGR